jgi:hypothetical protein
VQPLSEPRTAQTVSIMGPDIGRYIAESIVAVITIVAVIAFALGAAVAGLVLWLL